MAHPLTTEIYALRDASRRVVRELGLLAAVPRAAGVSLAHCHLLVELERRDGSATVSELAAVLLLDKSTVSRTVDSLRQKKWLRLTEDPGDRRRKLVGLTRAGIRALERIHRSAGTQVSDALAHLSAQERQTVLRGMSLYGQALQKARTAKGYVIRPIAPEDNRELATIVRRVALEFDAVGPGGPTADAELDDMAEAYSGSDRGYFVIESEGRRLVGGAGFGPLEGGEPGVCELRKMYLVPEARGQGLGRSLLELCLHEAGASGYQTCYLETTERMRSARALYTQLGFEALSCRLGDTGHSQCDMHYVKEL